MKTFVRAKTGDSRNTGSTTGLADPIWRGQAPAVRQVLHGPVLQPKLTLGAPDDAYEREADRVANQVMRMPDAEVRAPPAPPRVQRLCSECEEELRAKPAGGGSNPAASVPLIVHDVLRGPGKPLDAETRAFFEPRFGKDFSQVRVHSNSEAAESTGAVNAPAYTVGRNIVFGRGQRGERTHQGRRQIAHELTHVVQQTGADAVRVGQSDDKRGLSPVSQQTGSNATIQRQHVPDTGFRYTPPSGVTRSIVEIQGVVGVTPDGVYGENTRLAVEKYQTKLKAEGFYSDSIDGKWGTNTEAAHVAFATGPNVKRKGYNCAGFAFKDYGFHSMSTTKSRYAATTKLADCTKDCPKPYQHKFWYWEFDINVSDTTTGTTTATWRDFHTVGGQTDKSGKEPGQVMSKDGPRPVVGPKPPLSWKPVTEPVLDDDNNVVPDKQWNILSIDEECFCNDTLP